MLIQEKEKLDIEKQRENIGSDNKYWPLIKEINM
jgi:hypothetical protein